tara:strand:+ start:662 stop:781 length:120 start_codon:yes stop_codon:yes gene_type:complete
MHNLFHSVVLGGGVVATLTLQGITCGNTEIEKELSYGKN